MSSGYTSLFDPNGPAKFSRALDTVTSEMGKVVSSFVALGQKSDASLTGIGKQFDTLIAKAGQYSQTLGGISAPAGPGGTPTPAGPSGWTPPTVGNSGGVGGQQGDGGLGGNHGPPANQTIKQTNAQNGGTQDPPQSRFGPGTPMGTAMALGSAAVGAAQDFTAPRLSTAVTASAIAQQAQTMYGSTNADVRRNIMQVPRGTLTVGGQQDYSGFLSAVMGVMPIPGQGTGAANAAQFNQLNQVTNAWMRMNPGVGRTQVGQSLIDMFNNPQNQQRAIGLGFDLMPGGQMAKPQDIALRMLGRTMPGQPLGLDALTATRMLAPGGSVTKGLEAIGVQQGTPLFQGMSQYLQGLEAWTRDPANRGKPLPDPTTRAGQTALKMNTGAANALLKKQSDTTSLESKTTQGLADASTHLDKAADTLINAANVIMGHTGAGGIIGKGLGFLGKLGPIGQQIAGPLALGAELAGKIGVPGTGGGGGNINPGGAVSKTGTAPQVTAGGQVLGAGAALTATGSAATLATQLASMVSGGAAPGGASDWWGTLQHPVPGSVPFFDVAGKTSAATASTTASASGTLPTAATTAGSGTLDPTKAGTQSKEAWASLLLTNVGGIQLTQNNIDNVRRWMTLEEPPSNWFNRNNPLNASLGNGSTDGTGAYSSLDVAAQYTAKMINQKNMAMIKAALAANASPTDFANAIKASPWDTGYKSMAANAFEKVGMARGSYNVDRTQLALVHRGERVIPAADNYSAAGRYQRGDATGATTGPTHVHMTFHPSSIQLNVPANATASDMNDIAQQFVQAISRPEILQNVRSS